jgi:hypothetical protein
LSAIIETLVRAAFYLLGYLIAALAGSWLVTYVLSKLQLTEEQRKNLAGIKGAGQIIGIIERILTVTFIYMNAPTAIALVFAAKSIIRFEQAKDRPFAEYYLIGTMTSITLAALVGIVFAYVAQNFTLPT